VTPPTSPRNTVLVSSTQPEEGKTVLAASLALTMTLAGRRVLLVDGDLRRPNLHKIFGLENSKGFAQILTGAADVAGAAQQIDLPGLEPGGGRLAVTTSGTTAPLTANALASPHLGAIVGAMAQSFDTVLIDSPPVLSASDALYLAPVVDGIIFVLRAGAVSEQDAKRARERLLGAGGHLLGFVMNHFDERQHGPGYHPYHGHYVAADSSRDRT
jgi:capsular exopolysaccharide synthesis family protein